MVYRGRWRIFAIFKLYRGRLLFAQALLFGAALASIGFATLTQGLVNDGMRAGDAAAALSIGFWMFVLAVISGVLFATAAGISIFFAQGTSYTVRTVLYDKLQQLSFANFDRLPSSALMVRLNADALNVQNGVMFGLLLGLYAPFLFTIALVLVIINTPELVWLLLVIIAVVVVLLLVMTPPIFRAFEERQKRLDDVNEALTEDVTGIQVVKTFVREDYEVERFTDRAEAMRVPSLKAAWRVAFLTPLLTGTGQLASLAVVFFGGVLVLEQQTLDVGQIVVFSQYLGLIVGPLAIMAMVIPMLLRANTSVDRIMEVLDEEPTVRDRPETTRLDPAVVKGRIEFDNVTFAFHRPDGELDPPVLRDINLVIEPGERVGFLGATGAGKTALVNLIARYYDVTEGRVLIDGTDVRDVTQENLREIVGVALQETVLFQGDLRFNMKFAAHDADDEVMVQAAVAADSLGFVSNLPQQWEAPVARRGYNFSGGQRQRLSINRALVPKPKILILDDSTSALDATTEGRVQAAVPGFIGGSTTLYVAQRVSAVVDLDKIVLLKDGAIVGAGTHEELLKDNDLYREIYESQLGSDVLEGVSLSGADDR